MIKCPYGLAHGLRADGRSIAHIVQVHARGPAKLDDTQVRLERAGGAGIVLIAEAAVVIQRRQKDQFHRLAGIRAIASRPHRPGPAGCRCKVSAESGATAARSGRWPRSDRWCAPSRADWPARLTARRPPDKVALAGIVQRDGRDVGDAASVVIVDELEVTHVGPVVGAIVACGHVPAVAALQRLGGSRCTCSAITISPAKPPGRLRIRSISVLRHCVWV